MRHLFLAFLLVPFSFCRAATDYVGPAVCASCHKQIAASQARTNMALTWHGANTDLLPGRASEAFPEGPPPEIEYAVQRSGLGFVYRVQIPSHPVLELPVETIVGGKRHGISFLARLSEVEGMALERPVLLEARYLHSVPHNRLELSAGFPPEKPSSYETALGRAITPEFEKKCLACHGEPSAERKVTGGVHCEACHGAGKPHLQAVAAGQPHSGVWKGTESCGQCHSGFSPLADPMPEDLLISSQVTALAQSECARQSAGKIGCLQCHDPHADAKDVVARSEKTCVQCHAAEAATKGRCLECHMPVETRGSFHMADHWIRVHPERTGPSPHTISAASGVTPVREFLRMIAVDDRVKAESLRTRVVQGESFFSLARDHSIDRSKVSGGFLGDVAVAPLGPPLHDAVAALHPGDITPVLEAGGRYVILQRLPRDFRWQAGQVLQEASRLKAGRKLDEAARKYLEALEIYPRFLRALIFLGATLGEQGNAERAIATLEFATKLYPRDAAAHYNLGIAYDSSNRGAEAQAEYRHAIEIEPSLIPAYQNLGAGLILSGRLEEAEQVFHDGLRANPLSAILYYNLSLTLAQRKDETGARKARELALKIDPAIATR